MPEAYPHDHEPDIEFRHSEQLDAIALALAKAEASIPEAEADSVGCIQTPDGECSYRYANLAGVRKVIRKPLSRNGLAVIQLPGAGNRGEVRLTTILLHESGQWIAGTTTIPLPVPTPQGFGSALTYARRYTLAAMLNVCVEDDDGAAASPVAAGRGRATASTAPAKPPRRLVSGPATAANTPDQNEQAPSAKQEQWRSIPYNRATERDLKCLARAYAEARGVDSVSSDDIRRDFGITGRLVDHFGGTPLGHIADAAARTCLASEAVARTTPGGDDAVQPAGEPSECSTPAAA